MVAIAVTAGLKQLPKSGALTTGIGKGEHLTLKMYLADLARYACLSESNLMHMFVEQISIPPRR